MTVKSLELESRLAKAVASGVGTRSLFAERASNAELWDVDGNHYVDFAAGIAVNNTGHRHPAVMAAVAEQAGRYTHTCFHVAPYEGYVRLAERLNTLVCTGEDNRTMLATTGAEAVENAVKIARAYTGRPGVIAFSGAFHGRTLMGMALTGKVVPYKKNFGPFPSDIFHAPFPSAFVGISVEEALTGLEARFAADIDPQRVAAIIVEPVQGEGGFNVAPPEFLRKLRGVCDAHGIVMIVDEIQSGMARTGKMFAFEHSGIAPDLVTMAKGLAGGFPLSAVTGKAAIMNAAHAGGLGGTYAGNPISVAAANAVLDVIDREALCVRATEIGRFIVASLTEIASRPGMQNIGDVRGLGAMVAFEVVQDRRTKRPAPDLVSRLVREAQARGLILLSCGTHASVIRLLPPLTIGWDTLEHGLTKLQAAIEITLNDASKI